MLRLCAIGQIAGIHGVEFHVQPPPVRQIGAHQIRQIYAGNAVEPARMRGEHRGGHGASLHAHRREHGQHHRERAAAHAAQIVHDRRRLHRLHGNTFFLGDYTVFAPKRQFDLRYLRAKMRAA